MTTSDAGLLAAADPDAFRELYARYAERVYGYFVRRSGDHDAAFDLTAETFAQAWIMRQRFRDEATAAPDERWAEQADELLDALPETQREAVRLRVVDQLDYDEVA